MFLKPKSQQCKGVGRIHKTRILEQFNERAIETYAAQENNFNSRPHTNSSDPAPAVTYVDSNRALCEEHEKASQDLATPRLLHLGGGWEALVECKVLLPTRCGNHLPGQSLVRQVPTNVASYKMWCLSFCVVDVPMLRTNSV